MSARRLPFSGPTHRSATMTGAFLDTTAAVATSLSSAATTITLPDTDANEPR